MRASRVSVIGSALAGSVFVLACLGGSCGGETDAPSPSGEEPRAPTMAHAVARGVVRDPPPDGTPLRYDLPRGAASTLSIQTLPNAVCILRAAGEPAADAAMANHLRVYADEEGVARLPFRHADAAASGAELALDCSGEAGARRTYALDVRVVDGAASEAPAEPSRAGKPTFPVLEANARALPGAELLAHEYPPRPLAGPNDMKWRELVTSGATVITPHLIAVPAFVPRPALVADRLVNGTGSSANWSGYASALSASAYGEVFGAWYVPRVSSQASALSVDYSTFWVGIDGFGTNDVVQAGTAQNTETIFGIEASSYGAWTEWYPLDMQYVSNFPVNPGDEIETWVWVASSANVWTPAGGNGWFLIWNVTENMASEVVTAIPFGVTFTGRTAEWVMERPTVNGHLTNLANYGTAQMSDAWAYDYGNEAHLYTSDDSTQLTMTNGADVLSTVMPETPNSLVFVWRNSN